jgi:hypothetical protein
MRLRAAVTASPRDEEREDLSFVYAYDTVQKYCVSLSRAPGSELIELMVSDQLNVKVSELLVTLSGQKLTVEVAPAVAAELDGNCRYDIELVNAEEGAALLQAALQAIFSGKQGLRVAATL